jgi:CRP/FNR family transcriptional regulator
MSKISLKNHTSELMHITDNTFHLKKGEYLYYKNDVSTCIMFVFSGSIKTVDITERGEYRIKEFLIPQDITGLDAMMDTRHSTHAIALEDSIIKAISYEKFYEFAIKTPCILESLDVLRAAYMSRKDETRRILDNPRAESKLASFLINQTNRMSYLGYSSQQIELKMTHKDIANFLGVKSETISRALHSLIKKGAILLKHRSIQILDMYLLKLIVRPLIA